MTQTSWFLNFERRNRAVVVAEYQRKAVVAADRGRHYGAAMRPIVVTAYFCLLADPVAAAFNLPACPETMRGDISDLPPRIILEVPCVMPGATGADLCMTIWAPVSRVKGDPLKLTKGGTERWRYPHLTGCAKILPGER